MLGVASDILPFLLAGAFLPTWTLMTIALLETERPVQNSTVFVAGNVAFRLVLGVVVLYVLGEAPVFEIAEPAETPTSIYIFVIVGLVFIALALREFIKRDEPAGAGAALLDRFERLSPLTSLVAGVLVVAAPGVQWVYFLGGLDVIIGAEASAAASLLSLVLFVVALQAMLVAPIAIYLAFPKSARARLDAFDAWIRRNSRRTSAAILALLGIYLVWRGAAIAIAIDLI